MKINQGCRFAYGTPTPEQRAAGDFGNRIVNLPHDYMIESDMYPDAPAQAASGYYNAGVVYAEGIGTQALDLPVTN